MSRILKLRFSSFFQSIVLISCFMPYTVFALTEESFKTIMTIGLVDKTYQKFYSEKGQVHAMVKTVRKMQRRLKQIELSIIIGFVPPTLESRYTELREKIDEMKIYIDGILRDYNRIVVDRPRFETHLKQCLALCDPEFGKRDETDDEVQLNPDQKIMVYSLECLGLLMPMLASFDEIYPRVTSHFAALKSLESDVETREVEFKKDLSRLLRPRAVAHARPLAREQVRLPPILIRRR